MIMGEDLKGDALVKFTLIHCETIGSICETIYNKWLKTGWKGVTIFECET